MWKILPGQSSSGVVEHLAEVEGIMMDLISAGQSPTVPDPAGRCTTSRCGYCPRCLPGLREPAHCCPSVDFTVRSRAGAPR
jgi:hypothetical protein